MPTPTDQPAAAPAHAFASGNRYADQIAAQRRLYAVSREKAADHGVQANSQSATFASLQRGRPVAGTLEQSLRLLAGAASRRIARWQDPATGGYDPADRKVLLRQAAEMNVPAATAEAVLHTVAEAFRKRRAEQQAAAKPEAAAQASWINRGMRRLRRVRWLTWAAIAFVVLVLVGSQVLFLSVWLELLG